MPANRLAREKSPYLQQHANNPVDWYPWGSEALEKSKNEAKPIFLSVGYSTCHWCHVMEHESFENTEIADLLNRHFVPVKVDREERPDIDRMYMAYVQAATGSGGWPMSVWLTPEGSPFVGGTYFPPVDRYGRPGFATVLQRIAAAWDNERDRITESSAGVLAQLQQQMLFRAADGDLDTAVLDRAFSGWRRSFDPRNGGFGQAPKFPRPAVFDFLLRYWKRTATPEALEMVKSTFSAMSRGGMNDQLGGGFHRYSVDEYWFVPHFEKMLYDQAQIVSSLVEVFQITGEEEFAQEARRVLDYVLREMTSPEGAFYSAEDADSALSSQNPSHKSEGAFYIWTADEIAAVLGEEAARLFSFRYGVQPDGNVETDPHGEFEGRNILSEANSLEETARRFNRDLETVRAELAECAAKLLTARAKRPRPHLDDKVLTSWNALMISAFAKAGAVLDEPRYRDAARRSAEFLRSRMWQPSSGTLLRRYRNGDAAIPGFLDDYAFFVRALLDLYEAEFQAHDLELAIAVGRQLVTLFSDPANGAFFVSAPGHAQDQLALRMKDDYDGAEPSGNSIATLSFLRLERITGDRTWGDLARSTLRSFGGHLESQPFGVPLMLAALELSLSAPKQVVIAGEIADTTTQEMLRALTRQFEPNRVLVLADPASVALLASGNPALSGMRSVDGKTAAYVCENFACQLPVATVPELLQLLQ